MNDQELKDILDAWDVPPVTGSLRQNVRARFAASLERELPSKRWGGWFTAKIAAVTVVCLLALGLFVNEAVPQVAKMDFLLLNVPFTVDSEFTRYADDGSSSVEMYTTSFTHNGYEVLLSRSFPDQPFRTGLSQVMDWIGLLMFDISLPFSKGSGKQETARTAFIKNGCTASGQIVSTGEAILGYRTVVIHYNLPDDPRATLWMAPDLACFGLKFIIEKKQSDGTFHLLQTRRAIRVNLRQ
jgi:hypothetical protein